jgi:hypothetical protein
MDKSNVSGPQAVIDECLCQKSCDCLEIKPPTPVRPEWLGEAGILFQINRQILHPLGMEIAINDGALDDYTAKGNLIVVSHNDPQKEEGVGLIFTKDELEAGRQAFNTFMLSSGMGIVKRRVSKYAYVVQEEK